MALSSFCPTAAPAVQPPPDITADAALLAPPSCSEAHAAAFIVQRGSIYAPADIGVIVGHYWRFGPLSGINPLLALAQCIHETSAEQEDGTWWPLSSWWAMRPRRNPAGLGVTGRTRTITPPFAEPPRWAWDERTALWREGLSFSGWVHAVKAHLGRLLAYALPEGAENRIQAQLVGYALAWRALPQHYRGIAPTLHGLTGTWATDPAYSEKLVRVANAILNTAPASPPPETP